MSLYSESMPEMEWFVKPQKTNYEQYTIRVFGDKALTTVSVNKRDLKQVLLLELILGHLQSKGVDAVKVMTKKPFAWRFAKGVGGDHFWYKASDGTRHYCEDNFCVSVFNEGVDQEAYDNDLQEYTHWCDNVDEEFRTKALEALCLTDHAKAHTLYDLCKGEIEWYDDEDYSLTEEQVYSELWRKLCKFKVLLEESSGDA